VLKISILSSDSSKVGFSALSFAFLDENFPTNGTFSDSPKSSKQLPLCSLVMTPLIRWVSSSRWEQCRLEMAWQWRLFVGLYRHGRCTTQQEPLPVVLCMSCSHLPDPQADAPTSPVMQLHCSAVHRQTSPNHPKHNHNVTYL